MIISILSATPEPTEVMGDAAASDIYQRFLRTPLRLKNPPTPVKVNAGDGATPASTETGTNGTSKANEAAMAASGAADIESLQDRIGGALLGGIATATNASAVKAARPGLTVTTSPIGQASERPMLSGTKTKRNARSIMMVNRNTGGIMIDTPTKSNLPPKKSRKAFFGSDSDLLLQTPSAALQVEKENEPDDDINRNLSSMFAADSSDDEAVPAKPEPPATVVTAGAQKIEVPLKKQPERRSSRRVQSRSHGGLPSHPHPAQGIDEVSKYCDALLAKKTTSGAFFALLLNSLRSTAQELEQKANDKATEESLPVQHPLHSLFNICVGVARCEVLALAQVDPRSTPMKPKPSPKISRRSTKTRGIAMKKRTLKKKVRFQSFNFSCLQLQYVEDERVELLVDAILKGYAQIMEHIERHPVEGDDHESIDSTVLRHAIETMRNLNALYSEPRSTEKQITRIYNAAFGAKDEYTQHEIKAAGKYFAGQFAKLTESAGSAFLQDMFSSLLSSTTRYKLRVLLLPFDDQESDEEASIVRKQDPSQPTMATYMHQDLGAAVHRALREILMFKPLVDLVVSMMDKVSNKAGGLDHTAINFMENLSSEDLEGIEQYVLACRFARFHLQTAFEDPDKDEYTLETWASLQLLCSLAKRLQFEDEAHLYPLASISEFVADSKRQEPTFERMEKTLQQFFKRKEVAKVCAECKSDISIEENLVSITCTICSQCYHLKCLRLPASFVQFARQYSCPSCFLCSSK